MNRFKKAIFFGNSYKIAQAINRLYPLEVIYCERKQFTKPIFNLASLIKSKFVVVDEGQELSFPEGRESILAVSYGFGVIFSSEQINLFPNGIWNIHTGKLPEFRGRHPISWAFIRNKFKFYVSIHEINEEIDQGYLLAEEYVNRDINDTQSDIEDKFERILEDHLLLRAIDNFTSGKKIRIEKGEYTKSLIAGFDGVSPEEQESAYMYNLIKAQSKYGGIKIKGKNYCDCTFVNEDFIHLYKAYDFFICKDNVKIGLK